jgi:sugar-specific transcriptional regulator TrmB
MEKNIQILRELGLTSLQAKIYLILVETGKEKAMTISKKADVDRANTYQTLRRLHKMGLVEKTLGKPNLYEALPMQKGIAILLQKKQYQYIKIQKEADELLRQTHAKKEMLQEVTEGFKIIQPTRESLLQRITKFCSVAQDSWDLMLNKRIFLDYMINFPEPHLECMKRGVKYRVIIEKIDPKPILKPLKRLMKESNFRIRYISRPPRVVMTIRDRKQVDLCLQENRGIGEGPILQQINSSCVEVFQVYFDRIWYHTLEYKLNDISHKRKRMQTLNRQNQD